MFFKWVKRIVEYNYNLLPAEVVSVYNNLIVDVRLEDGQIAAAFCGAIEIAGICKPKMRVWLKRTSHVNRLILYNIAFVKTPEGMIFANPKYNRQLFTEAFEKGMIPELSEYTDLIPLGMEDNINGMDFELSNPQGKRAFVFVTAIYEKLNGCAVFPRSTNFFEIKMLEQMTRKKQSGDEAYIFMIVPREDCVSAKFVWTLDPPAAAALFEAAKNGLNFLCYGCKINKNRIEINRKMEILY